MYDFIFTVNADLKCFSMQTSEDVYVFPYAFCLTDTACVQSWLSNMRVWMC